MFELTFDLFIFKYIYDLDMSNYYNIIFKIMDKKYIYVVIIRKIYNPVCN